MKVNDKREFQKAMKKKFHAHSDRKRWEVIPIKDVPDEENFLDSI